MFLRIVTITTALVQLTLAQSAVQIWNFTTVIDIENSVLRPNGQLLFTTLTNSQLYVLDPAVATPEAKVVVTAAGATALTGIAAIGYDQYAVIGGVRGSYSYTNETIYIVDFSGSGNETNGAMAIIQAAITLPDAVMLNGIAALPSNPRVLLAADSRVACLWRIDLDAGTVTKAIADDTMAAPVNASVPIGVDGLKISGGYAYYSNVAKSSFARIAINEDGSKATGTAEVLASFAMSENLDDFADNGTYAYASQNPSYVSRISLETGELTILVNETSMAGGPTGVVLAQDGLHAYVTTRGDSTAGTSGQVFEVLLS